MAAMQVVLSYLPGIPVVGVEGAKIGIVSSVVPIFGLLLGPWLGFASAFMGSTVSRVLSGANAFTWLTLPAMPLSAFLAGCLSRRNVGVLKGWMVSALTLGGLILAWYATWMGKAALLYPLLHWAGMAIILIFREALSFFYNQISRAEFTLSVGLCGFASVMVAHMCGTLAFVCAAEFAFINAPLVPDFFIALVPVVAVERLVLTLIMTVLGVPIILSLRGRSSFTQPLVASMADQPSDTAPA